MQALLKKRAVIQVSGEDTLAFLQGLLTQDLQEDRTLSYGLLLSAKGRIIADLFVYQHQEYFLLDCDAQLVERVHKLLELYRLRSRVEIKQRQDLSVVVSWKSAPVDTRYFHEDPRLVELGFRGLVPKTVTFLEEIVDDLEWAYYRYDLGVPEGADDILPDKAIPLEYNFDYLQAISWTKGCYVGQELTARTKFVGEIRKRIFLFVVIEGTKPIIGETLTANQLELGEVVNIVDDRGLLKLRYQEYFFEPGKPAIFESANGGICEVNIPKWLKSHILNHHE